MGSEDGTFGERTDYEVDESPVAVALGDVSGDGHIDIVTANDNSYVHSVSVLLGQGDGTFTARTDYAAGAGANSLVLGDWNNDRLLDWVTANFNGLSIRFNQAASNQEETSRSEQRYTYDPVFNQVTSETDELGRTTLYEIDPITGNTLSTTRVVGELDPENGETDDVVTRYTYTPAGWLDTETDPLGRVTDYDYDSWGRRVKITLAQGTEDEATQEFEYDEAGNQTAFIDERGIRTQYEYDELNRLVKTIYAVGTLEEAEETVEYDEAGNQVATVDANGNRTEYKYDSMNQLVQTTAPDPDGAAGPLTAPVTTQTYDAAGNLVATVDPLGRETRYVYDSRARLVETIHPDGTVEKTSYDFDNNPTANFDANSNPTRQVYDARGRLVRESRTVDGQEQITRFEYDAANQMTAIVDANGNRTEYEYDELGRQIAVVEAPGTPDEVVTSTEYDKAGNAIAEIDGLGHRTEYAYGIEPRYV